MYRLPFLKEAKNQQSNNIFITKLKQRIRVSRKLQIQRILKNVIIQAVL